MACVFDLFCFRLILKAWTCLFSPGKLCKDLWFYDKQQLYALKVLLMFSIGIDVD